MHDSTLDETKLRPLRTASVLVALISLSALISACASGAPDNEARKGSVDGARSGTGGAGKAQQALAGVDGKGSIGKADTIVNQYTTLAANAAAAATSIQVGSVAALAAGADALAAGDLLLVVQMQGATVQTAVDDNTWGQVSALGGAGLYEFVEVTGVSSGTNTISLSCALKNAYSVAGQVQVIRVPQYDSLTVSAGASITAPAWDGATGGVVAVHAKTAVTLAGDISASALGFRGGPTDNDSNGSALDTAIFASASSSDGARKGEGIAGLLAQFGRAPAANGGGGGTAHNGGGGGGANARNGKAWTGQGTFDLTVKGGKSWSFDPNYSATPSEGGGRGGYSYSSSNQDALTLAPGDPAWGGNQRRERGGLGGHGLTNDPATRVFLGGGGGAGDGNNGHAGRGGTGGGMVFVLAGSVTGTGKILANGEDGVDAVSTAGGSKSGDSPGGGGGGGSVIVRAAAVSGISVQAHGGGGGNQLIANANEAEGPGGGGGGGFISVPAAITADVAGGLGGTTNSPALTEFPSNGATVGSAGQTELGAAASGVVPYCVDGTAPTTTIVTNPTNPTSDTTGDFTFVSNDGAATFECRVDAGVFAACTTPFATPALLDGSHTFQVRAKDAVGNVDATPASFTWTVDTTLPDTTIATKPSASSNDTTGDFTFTSNEAGATFECKLDAAATFVACATPYVTTALAEGSHTLTVRAKDAAGNVDATPAVYTWAVDLTAPDTTLVNKPTNPTTNPIAGFSFTASEVGSTFQCKLDSAAFAPCTTPLATASLAAGNHTFQVRAVDPAGNVDATPAIYTWVVRVDSDGDGLDDGDETGIGTSPQDADSDDDGIPDGAETTPGVDTDGDGLVDARDPDSDNDGILDGTEAGVTTPPPGTDVTKGHFVPDADPLTTTDPLDADTDNGGVRDGAEDPNHNGKIDSGERNPNNPADDSTPATDTDSDGLSDDDETAIGTNPMDADSDDDGVLDGAEPNPSDDTDGDGLINPLDPDSDNDGLFDGTELGLGCNNPATSLARRQCVADADSGATKTSPLDPDTDHGGARDGSEDSNLNGALDAGERDPTLGHGSDDANLVDADGDGLSDATEDTLGSNPNDADSDDDGVRDGDEPNPSADGDGDGLIDVLDVDSDNDGLFDGTEVGKACSDPATNNALGHCRADADPLTHTSAVNPDTDRGGAKDGSEDANLDGKKDTGEGDPVVGHGGDDASVVDTDSDGLSDGTETTMGSNPNDKDSDDDGLLDGDEPNPADDRDGDGKPDILDPDSDGDGLFDGTEAGKSCSNAATDISKGQCTADADGGATTTFVLTADTDRGGVSDGLEDTNHDGAKGAGERDPLNGTDDTSTTGDGGAGGGGGSGGEAGAGDSGGNGGDTGDAGAGAGGDENGGAPQTGGSAGTAGTAGNGGVETGGTTGTGGSTGGTVDSGGVPATGGSAISTGGAEPKPEKVVVLGGGLCAFRPAAGDGTTALLAASALALCAVRRRRRR